MEETTEASTTTQETSDETATKYGAVLELAAQPDQTRLKRRSAAGFILIASALSWVVFFVCFGLATETLAWSIALMVTAATIIALVYGKENMPSLSLFKPGELKPVSFTECAAMSFVGFSLAICCWLSLHKFHLSEPREVRRQVVDIEFVSSKDYADHHDILPSSEPKPTQKKRQGTADKTVQGTKLTINSSTKERVIAAQKQENTPLNRRRIERVAEQPPQQAPKVVAAVKIPAAPVDPARKPASKPTPVVVQQKSEAKNYIMLQPDQNDTQTATARANAVPMPSRWATKSYTAPVQLVSNTQGVAPKPKKASAGMMLEEMAPPELIELADTQGDSKSTDSYQAGGRSSGGKGAQSALSNYLTDLHKRIKRAWSPPAGETRNAEILFRIKSNGHLASIKLMHSSGDEDADEAAMHAIAANSPFKPLPDEFERQYLDVLYTFNYKVSALSEVSGARTQ